jgi:alkylation response protein AidB-like acyl-CoA dehydrogenase
VAIFATRLEEEITTYVRDLAVDGHARALPPSLRQEVMRRYVEGRTVGLLGQRTMASVMAGGDPGPEQQIIKLAWSLLCQRFSETRHEISGLSAVVGLDQPLQDDFLSARAATIAAGTTEIVKNVVAQRVLGLPRDA